MPKRPVRLATRAVIVHEDRLLLVNAWADPKRPLLCAPGGGVETGASLPENLRREVVEETGLDITVGDPCLINEFHDPATGWHQVEVFFRCRIEGNPVIDPTWQDPENIVTRHIWATEQEMRQLVVKPDSLRRVAFSPDAALSYDPLEQIVR
ncbi:NUDIX domain-containing protein [uncultured Roseobacter sp.]|uniref:NUDIX domain-containing protein n=1 Tax=uncultured Roseobacter sp. TaxID=114847 RepID=UPI002625E034|nr:NUDIX domain-containing protein [uncultured Roseobacter sp.]